MNGFKKVAAMVVALGLLTSISSAAFATEVANSNKATDYSALEKSIQDDTLLPESVKLDQLTRLFFEAKQENFLSAATTNNLMMFYTSQRTFNSISSDYSSKLFEFERAVRQNSSHERVYEKFDVTIPDITISGKTASVTAYEYLEYILADYEDIVSSRGITYYIDFVKDGSDWKISNITTDNELEQLVSQYDNVETLIALACTDEWTPVESPEIETAHQNATGNLATISTSATYPRRSYSAIKAINYAKQYTSSDHSTSTTKNYNPDFPSFNPNDCQNFVSQCIWAGLGGTEAFLEEPMISESSGRDWYCYYENATGTAVPVYSTTWTSIKSFSEYVKAGNSTKPGLYGKVGETGEIANCYAGDALQLCYSAKKEDYYHTYLIVKATYTNGVRTNDDLWVCAHTANRNNELLSEVVGDSQATLRAVAISGSYW